MCRNIIKQSMNILTYYHDYVHDISNLGVEFVNSCNYKGDFKPIKSTPKYQFYNKAKISRELNSCIKSRNQGDWF